MICPHGKAGLSKGSWKTLPTCRCNERKLTMKCDKCGNETEHLSPVRWGGFSGQICSDQCEQEWMKSSRSKSWARKSRPRKVGSEPAKPDSTLVGSETLASDLVARVLRAARDLCAASDSRLVARIVLDVDADTETLVQFDLRKRGAE